MPGTKYSQKGCWTCKTRKVQCDRAWPNCQRCVQTSRECGGYENRLSWPRQDDERRSLTASPIQPAGNREIERYQFINSAPWHVEQLCSPKFASVPTLSLRLSPAPSTAQGSSDSALEWDKLVDYFNETAYLSLITFNTPSSAVRDVLIRIICRGNSDSEKGVYLALLAFSSLHRKCFQQSAYLKLYAVQALAASSRQLTRATPNLSEAMCHVAACMLLCALETLAPSASSGEWLWYVLGAMSVIYSTNPEGAAIQEDVGVLLDWFYYHYALSRFATRHWNHKTVIALETEGEDTRIRGTEFDKQMKIAWQKFLPTHTILSLLAEACDTLASSNAHSRSSSNNEYHGKIAELTSRVNLLPLHWTPSGKGAPVLASTVEVYQAAMLIYLKQASRGPWELSSPSPWLQANSIDALVDAIFEGHIEVSAECKHLFPLLMIACEARSEERRAAIMRCIERTSGNNSQARNFDRIRAEIKRMWVQQDLYADIDLREDTQRLLSAVVSSNLALPSYA